MNRAKPMKKEMKCRNRGFTLLEMMVVLAIIAIILGGAVRVLKGVIDSAREDRVRSDYVTLEAALLKYQISSGTLPTSEQGLEALVSRPTTAPVPRRWTQIADAVPLDPWYHPYRYRFPGSRNPRRFEILCSGPDGLPGTEDDISSQEE